MGIDRGEGDEAHQFMRIEHRYEAIAGAGEGQRRHDAQQIIAKQHERAYPRLGARLILQKPTWAAQRKNNNQRGDDAAADHHAELPHHFDPEVARFRRRPFIAEPARRLGNVAEILDQFDQLAADALKAVGNILQRRGPGAGAFLVALAFDHRTRRQQGFEVAEEALAFGRVFQCLDQRAKLIIAERCRSLFRGFLRRCFLRRRGLRPVK